ncbi:MAG: hypothetical protein L0I62_02760 [Gammaproteobacteria bacterium]|nr:hypothetical protein [Gammaproteobacteria bacterium]
MYKMKWLVLCGLLAGSALLGGCRAIHYSGCGWEVILSGQMSPYCAAMTNGVTGYDLPSPVKKAGFSVDLPNSGGWIVVRNTDAGVAMGRQGDDSGETYAIWAYEIDLPDLATPQAFQQYVDKQRAKDTDPKRFTILSNKETLIEHGPQGALCLRYSTTALDRHAHTAPSTYEAMHTTNLGLACRSPYDAHVAVTLVYSQRYHPENVDKTLSTEFDKIAATLRFEPVAETTKDQQAKHER